MAYPTNKRLVYLSGVVLVLLGLLLIFALTGCAAGHGPNGEVIVGWDIATLPENAHEALGAAAQFLPPPWNLVATGVLGLFGTAASAYAAKKSGDAKAERQAREAADRAWDESHVRTANLYTPSPPVLGGVPGGPVPNGGDVPAGAGSGGGAA